MIGLHPTHINEVYGPSGRDACFASTGKLGKVLGKLFQNLITLPRLEDHLLDFRGKFWGLGKALICLVNRVLPGEADGHWVSFELRYGLCQ